MAKVISQETFDECVKENIIEFSMSINEAKTETIEQFEKQGINLENILKDLTINDETGKPILNESIEKLQEHSSASEKNLVDEDLINNLQIIQSECKKSVPHRVLASKLEVQKCIILIAEDCLESDSNEIMLNILKCGSTLTDKNPDIFDADTLALLLKVMKKKENNLPIVRASLQWLAKACIMHEINRQNIMVADILETVKPFAGLKDPQTIRMVCMVFRYLILDDDIRVEFGKAHDHARLIASTYLIDLTKLLPEFEDVTVLSDLIITIAALVVRHELCVVVFEADGLKYVLELMKNHPGEIRLNLEALKLLKALAGHDQVKLHIMEQGAAPIIYNILNNYKANESVAKITLACISTLTLRVKNNSLSFFETNIPEIILETMKQHPKSKAVQRNAAWSIRNMISRAREYCDTFLSNDAESLLHTAMVDHPSIQHDIKAALRDLNCKVDLKEEWTGKMEKKILN